MTHGLQLERPARMEHLRDLVDVAVRAAEAAGADADTVHDVRLAVEEVCTNVIMHGYGGRGDGPVSVAVEITGGEIVIRISDAAPLLDLSTVPHPDTAAPADERPIGGLGWYFVRSVMDRVEQHGRGAKGNVFVLAKRVGGLRAPGGHA